MKIGNGANSIIQQMMTQRTGNPSNSAKSPAGGPDNDGDNDSSGKSSSAQFGKTAVGVDYAKLAAAINPEAIKPTRPTVNRDQNAENGASTQKSAQDTKSAGSTAKGESYNSSAKPSAQQANSEKGNIVNLTA